MNYVHTLHAKDLGSVPYTTWSSKHRVGRRPREDMVPK